MTCERCRETERHLSERWLPDLEYIGEISGTTLYQCPRCKTIVVKED